MILRHVALGAAILMTFAAPGMAAGASGASAVPSSMPRADADMQAVLDELAALGGKPIETLSPEEARRQPSPADAVKRIMSKRASNPRDDSVTTRDITYPAGGNSQQKARIYVPAATSGARPVVLYIHGGGWVIADIDTYDATPRALAKMADAVVVSIEYRHAPEAKFPAAHEDAIAAYRWVLMNAASFGGDPSRIALAGESAGGNMAVATAMAARDSNLQAPVHVLAVYPVADKNLNTESKRRFAQAKPLNTPMLSWFFRHTLQNPDQANDPRLDLVNANLRGLPATTIILADIDPLHDDGTALAAKLRQAGVRTDVKEYEGVTHEFFGMGSVVADAQNAETYAAAQLKAAFAASANVPVARREGRR